jgi:pimeloyl-ACP methyl ester carboxylesterase
MSTPAKNLQQGNIGGIAYTRSGAGKPVLLLHGLAASLHDWDALVPELVALGYETTCPDLPGHGHSYKSENLQDYQLENIFDKLLEWIEKLDFQKPMTVIGHSMGGYFSLELAIRHPDLVSKLVLVDPFYEPHQIPLLLRWGYREEILAHALNRTVPDWFYIGMIELTSIFIPGRRFLSHDLPRDVRKQSVENYKLASAGIYKLPLTGRNLEPFVGQINVPTLLVYGSRDQTLAPSSFPKLAALISNVLLKPVKAGHTPHQSNAEEFNRLVIDFLTSSQE